MEQGVLYLKLRFSSDWMRLSIALRLRIYVRGSREQNPFQKGDQTTHTGGSDIPEKAIWAYFINVLNQSEARNKGQYIVTHYSCSEY